MRDSGRRQTVTLGGIDGHFGLVVIPQVDPVVVNGMERIHGEYVIQERVDSKVAADIKVAAMLPVTRLSWLNSALRRYARGGAQAH